MVPGHPAGLAEDVSANVNFSAVNQSPWDPGAALVLSQDKNLSATINADLPTLNGNPVQDIASLLGVDLSSIANAGVSIGGSVTGKFSLDLGYTVSGGQVNVNYPALTTLTVPTHSTITGASNGLSPGTALTLSDNFQPGLAQTFSAPLSKFVQIAGGGYQVGNQSAGPTSIIQVKSPSFSTQFPSAAVWANVNYNVGFGGYVEAAAKVAGICIACYRQDFTIGTGQQSFELLNVNTQQVTILGQNYGNPSNVQIPLGPYASVTASVPNLAVQDTLSSDHSTVAGGGSQPVLTINGSLDKLAPFVGPILTNNFGPIGYTLLSATLGPQLSLYQNFSLTPNPAVDLRFSSPVLQQVNGNWQPTTSVTYDLSAPPTIKVPWSTSFSSLTVQPTYMLNDTFHNETGISVGATLPVSALALTTPLGPAGPVFNTTLTADALAKIPLYTNNFNMNLGQIVTTPFTLDVTPLPSSAGLLQVSTWELGSVLASDGATSAQIDFKNTLNLDNPKFSGNFDTTVLGSVLDFGTPSAPESMFLANNDVIAPDGTDLGDAFCIVCLDASGNFLTDSPAITSTDGQTLFTSDLSTYPSLFGCPACDPHLNGTSYFADTGPSVVNAGPTEFTSDVPEPSAALVLAPGLMALLLVRYRPAGFRRRVRATLQRA